MSLLAQSIILPRILFVFPALGMLLGYYWLYLDAAARGSSAPHWWAAYCTVLSPLIVGYLLYRSEIGGRIAPAPRRERIVGTLVIAHLVAILLTVRLLPPDPFTQLLYYPLLAVGGLPLGYLLVWRGGYARLRHRVGLVHDDEQRH